MHIYWIGNERILSYKPSTGMKNNWEVASNAQNSQKRQKWQFCTCFLGLYDLRAYSFQAEVTAFGLLDQKKTVWFDTTIVIFRHFQLKLTELLKIQGKSLYMFAKKITLYIGKLTQLSGYSYIYIQLFILHTIVLYTIHISVKPG